MLASEITKLCMDNYVLRKHFQAVLGADEAKDIKSEVSRNCFYILNTDNSPGQFAVLRNLGLASFCK